MLVWSATAGMMWIFLTVSTIVRDMGWEQFVGFRVFRQARHHPASAVTGVPLVHVVDTEIWVNHMSAVL